MRKTAKRTPRPLAKPLTPKQRADLLIAPQLHMQMLLQNQFELDYLASIAGIFNLANVLAAQLNRNDLEAIFDTAQELLLRLIDAGRPPSADEAPSFLEAFAVASDWVTMQNTATLTRALRYANWELSKPEPQPAKK